MNSAQEKSDCCGSVASSSRRPLPLAGIAAWPFPFAWPLLKTSSTVGPMPSSSWPLPLAPYPVRGRLLAPLPLAASGSVSTTFQSSSTRYSSALASASLAWAKTDSTVSVSSSSSPLTIFDEQMDGVAREQRKRLETIEDELEDVKRKLGRIWHFVETTDINMADASDRIKEHRERQERLEDAAADARAILSQRRAVLDDVNTIAAYAQGHGRLPARE